MTIGGNTTAIMQVRTTQKNAIGESVPTWVDAFSLFGWLDLSGGDSHYTYNAKVQQSTHIFLCDFQNLTALTDDFIWDVLNFTKYWIVDEESDAETIKVTSENSRMVVNGDVSFSHSISTSTISQPSFSKKLITPSFCVTVSVTLNNPSP